MRLWMDQFNTDTPTWYFSAANLPYVLYILVLLAHLLDQHFSVSYDKEVMNRKNTILELPFL
jgi:hypothetical protein